LLDLGLKVRLFVRRNFHFFVRVLVPTEMIHYVVLVQAIAVLLLWH
jgi:hypothetical protein